ncbi:hypothetical protein X801_02275, partial [Opisthorchis viverrini]
MNIPSTENGCNHYIMTAINRIRHIGNEDFMIAELGHLESYLSSCLDLQNLSVRTTQTVSCLMTNLIRHDKLQSSCMRVVYLLLQSACHPILKNILLGELESEIHNRFPAFPPSLQQIVWFCYQAHLLSTSNSGPILKFLLFQTQNQEWDKYELGMTAKRVKTVFTNYPEAILSSQDLLISLMFLLEQVMQNNSSEMFRFCVDCINSILGYVDSQALSRLVKQLPDRLTNVLFSLLEATPHNMLDETPSKVQAVMSHHGISPLNENSVDRKFHLVNTNKIPKSREMEMIPRQIRLQLSHKLDSSSRENAAECLKDHYWNYLCKMPSQFHSASNKNLSSVLSWFVELVKDDNCRVVYKVLQALELQDTAVDFAAALSRLLDVQQKHNFTNDEISKFDGDAIFNVISESLHNQMPCSIVDPILRKLEKRSMKYLDKVRNSLMNVPKTKHFRGLPHARYKTLASPSELGNGELPALHQTKGFFGCDYANRKKRTNFDNHSKNGASAAQPPQLGNDIELSDKSMCSLQPLSESSVQTMEMGEDSENGTKEVIHECYLNRSHATCRTRAKNTWSQKSSGDEISHCLNLLRAPDWDKQLEGLRRVQTSLQLEHRGEFDRLFKNEEELRAFTSALLSASRNLRSQVSRAAVNTIQAFGNLLISNGQGFLWDSQADRILHAILARITGDTSTRFLLNDAYKALEVVVKCLTPARAIVALSKQVYEQKVKSANSRLAVATQLDRLVVKAKNTSSLPRQLGSDGLQRLLKVSAQFLVDGILNTRICGQNILTILVNNFNLEETCRRTLSEPQWRNVEKLLVNETCQTTKYKKYLGKFVNVEMCKESWYRWLHDLVKRKRSIAVCSSDKNV